MVQSVHEQTRCIYAADSIVETANKSYWETLLIPKPGGKQTSEQMHGESDAPMAPCDNDDLSSRLAHSGELADELCLIRHVLATFHGPDEIKLSIPERLMQGICHLIVYCTAHALALGYTIGSVCLQAEQRGIRCDHNTYKEVSQARYMHNLNQQGIKVNAGQTSASTSDTATTCSRGTASVISKVLPGPIVSTYGGLCVTFMMQHIKFAM